jgi:tetratricopeptide (TPR) repeat protein
MLLLDQQRLDLAEGELRRELAANPDNALAHALLGLCLARFERYAEATDEAETAIRLAPDMALGHHARALVLADRNRLDEAVPSAEEAIRLDPEDAGHFALLSEIRFRQRRWRDALEAADAALRLDAEHVGATNARAQALTMLGRRAEAGQAIDTALSREPENALSHANMGWTLLHRGEPTRAAEHFREALRLDPEEEWARHGIVEALKAKNPLYGLLLRYFLWMSRLARSYQWAILVGGYLGYQALRGVARSRPDLAPLINPLLVLYLLFALMTWTAGPLFNLTLRLSRFGRLVLTPEEVRASNWVGATVLVALIALAAWLLTGRGELLPYALVFVALVPPVAAVFHCQPGWPRLVMTLIAAGLGLLGLAGVALALVGQPGSAAAGLSGGLVGVTLIGAFASQWIANGLIMARPRR